MFSSNEIRGIDFEEVKRGYNPTDVKAFLRKIAEQIEASEREKSALISEKSSLQEQMLVLADKIEEYRKNESSLSSVLLSAQKLGDDIVREAEENAEIIINEAKLKGEDILKEANDKVLIEQAELERMQNEVSKFRNEMISMYRSHLELISMIPEKEVKEEVVEDETCSCDSAESCEIEFEENVDFDDSQGYVDGGESPDSQVDDIFFTAENEVESNNPFADFSESGKEYEENNSEAESVEAEENFDGGETSRFGKLDFGDGFSFDSQN
ncbi:MAG: DivIVA domain-containing protein [Ruminococcaceae bacterium]|nr:DivIVA domain-containing protein [Oscillospiraceae bacterium]